MKNHAAILSILVSLTAMLLPVQQAQAQGRTTPVEVKNTPLVQIDKVGNTVTASQDGTWIVGIDGTPSVNVANTPDVHIVNTPNVSVANSPTVKIDGTTNTVKAAQSGTWNVGVTGTPAVAQSGTWTVGVSGTPNVNVANMASVSVANSPYVKIAGSDNTVRAPVLSSTVQLWTTDQTVANGAQLTSSAINCDGFRDLRFMGYTNSGGAGLTIRVEFLSPVAGYWYASVSQPFTGSTTALTTPVYGTYAHIVISNSLGTTPPSAGPAGSTS